METKFVSKLRFREDTAANWTIVNPVLDSSEPGRETDTGAYKIGDGVTPWRELPYQATDTAVIPDVSADGKLYARTRTASGELGTWQAIINDTRHNFNDLLQIPYDAPLNMGYKLTLPDGTKKTVYGIKKFFGINALPSTKVTEKVLDGVYSIVQVGGTFEVDEDETYLIPTNTDTFRSDVTLNASTHTVYVTTQSTQQRNNAKIDIWLMYTKVDDSNTDDDYHGTIGGGSTGGDSGSSPDTPSNPGLSFEQMLAERGLVQVTIKYADKDVIKIYNKGDIAYIKPDPIPENCVFWGWSTTEDLQTPILRFENHCTVYPIFQEVTDNMANTTFMVMYDDNSGSHGKLGKGESFLGEHYGDNGAGFNNYHLRILGWATEPDSIEPITHIEDLSKTYYAIGSVVDSTKIEPSCYAWSLLCEKVYPGEIEDKRYSFTDATGSVIKKHWARLHPSYKMGGLGFDGLIGRQLTTPAGTFTSIGVSVDADITAESTIYTDVNDLLELDGGDFYIVYVNSNDETEVHYTVNQIALTYSIVARTLNGVIYTNEEELAAYQVDTVKYNTYLEYIGVTTDPNSTEPLSTFMMRRSSLNQVYLIYECAKTHARINSGKLDFVDLQYPGTSYFQRTSVPKVLISNYLNLTSFTSGGVTFELIGFTTDYHTTTVDYTLTDDVPAGTDLYLLYKNTDTEEVLNANNYSNGLEELYRNRDINNTTIILQKPFHKITVSASAGTVGITGNTTVAYLPETHEGIGWSLTNCDTPVDTCPELIENIDRYLSILVVPASNLTLYYIYKTNDKYCSAYTDMGTVRYTLYSDGNTRMLNANFRVYDKITTLGSAYVYTQYETTISDCEFVGWTKDRIEGNFTTLPDDMIDHMVDLIGTIIVKAETFYAIYKRGTGEFTQNPTTYVNATFTYKQYYTYHSPSKQAIKVVNELIPTSNSTYTSLSSNSNIININNAGSPPTYTLVGWVHTTDGFVHSEQPTFADMSAKYTEDVAFIAIYKHPNTGFYYPATISDFANADTGLAEGFAMQRIISIDGKAKSVTYKKLNTSSSTYLYNNGKSKSYSFAGYKLKGTDNTELINVSTFDWKVEHELVEVYSSGSEYVTYEDVAAISFVVKNYTNVNTTYLTCKGTCTIEQLDTLINAHLHQYMRYNEVWYSDEALTNQLDVNTPLLNSTTIYGNATTGTSVTVQVTIHKFTGTTKASYSNRNLWSQLTSNSSMGTGAPYGYTLVGFTLNAMEEPSVNCPVLVNDDELITSSTLEVYAVYKHIDDTYFTDTMPEYNATGFSSDILCYGISGGSHKGTISQCWLETRCSVSNMKVELVGFTLDPKSKEPIDFDETFEVNEAGLFNTDPYDDPETGEYWEIYLYGIFKDANGNLYTDADLKRKNIGAIWSTSWSASVASVEYIEGFVTKEQFLSELESTVKSYISSTGGPKLTYIGFAFEESSSEPIDTDVVSLEAILDANLYAIYSYDNGTKVLYKGNLKTGSIRNAGITGTGTSYLYYFNVEHARCYLKSLIGTVKSGGTLIGYKIGDTQIDIDTYTPSSSDVLYGIYE